MIELEVGGPERTPLCPNCAHPVPGAGLTAQTGKRRIDPWKIRCRAVLPPGVERRSLLANLGWLHISDLHLKKGQSEWSQSVVLRALLDDVAARAKKQIRPHFILVSGDLAFSGLRQEYILVETLLDELRSVLSLPRERVFCVPGNHDNNISVQRTCHVGAQHILNSPQAVDLFLGDKDERETLLSRQREFRRFERSYSRRLHQHFTVGGLGYATSIHVNGLHICIVGLNSAWLCRGGVLDRGKLLVGERQLIDAIEVVKRRSPHLTIGIAHHPTDWLLDFDRSPVENHLFGSFNFFHRGHLHETRVQSIRVLGSENNCIVVAAGAAFVSRQFKNSYSYVDLNLETASCQVFSFTYSSDDSNFYQMEPKVADVRLRGKVPGTLAELAQEISSNIPGIDKCAYYLSGLLRGIVTDVPVATSGITIFASPRLLQDAKEPFREVSYRFLGVQNLIRMFPDNVPLGERIRALKDRLEMYGRLILDESQKDSSFGHALKERDEQMRVLGGTRMDEEFFHTRQLLEELANQSNWDLLEPLAKKHTQNRNPELSAQASRMLATCQAAKGGRGEEQMAADTFLQVARSRYGGWPDYVAAAALLHRVEKSEEAKAAILEGIQRFPTEIDPLVTEGNRLAMEMGDRPFRQQLKRYRKKT